MFVYTCLPYVKEDAPPFHSCLNKRNITRILKPYNDGYAWNGFQFQPSETGLLVGGEEGI